MNAKRIEKAGEQAKTTPSRPLDQSDLAPVYYHSSARKGTGGNVCVEAPDQRAFCAALHRRGKRLARIYQDRGETTLAHPGLTKTRLHYYRTLWHMPRPCVIPQALARRLPQYANHIHQSLKLLNQIRRSEGLAQWLGRAPYAARLERHFEIVSTVTDLGDELELQKVYLDAFSGKKVIGPDLFIKVNYLSSFEKDLSIRLRFSFGTEAFTRWESWEQDRTRSGSSAKLASAIFPESDLIVKNSALKRTLKQIIGHGIEFPERIIYSNAPQGGTFFHHDFVRSHVGVIFAQLQGVTGWLTLPGTGLVRLIKTFLSAPSFDGLPGRQSAAKRDRAYLKSLASNTKRLQAELNDPSEPLINLINCDPEFTRHLVDAGAMRILRPGDVILLPAPTLQSASWHSVFCLDDRPGLSLSFAIRKCVSKSPTSKIRSPKS